MRFRPSAWPMSSSIVVRGPGTHGDRPAGQGRQLLLEIRALQRLDDGFNLSFHDGGQAVERQADAMVGHAVLGKIVGADALAAPAGADLTAALGGVFGLFLVLL